MSAESQILLETGTNELEIIEFNLQYRDQSGKIISQPFGINVAKVREIIRVPEITSIPNLPEGVLGIINLRDHLTPVMDLTKTLYGQENDISGKKIIIAEFNQTRVGFIVSDVRRIHRLSWMEVETPDSFSDFNTQTSSVVGVIKFDDKIVMMLDVEKILAETHPLLGMEILDDSFEAFGQESKVFIVEDSAVIRNLIIKRLEGSGFTITSFNNGKLAWDRLQQLGEQAANPQELFQHVDVVITDIEMPRMDGYSLTRKIKEHPLLRRLPVVIFSSMITEDVRHKGDSVGADAQLSKPDLGVVVQKLEMLIKKRNDDLK